MAPWSHRFGAAAAGALVLSACAVPERVRPETSSVRFGLERSRSIQYVTSQIRAVRVAVTNQGTGLVFSQRYAGTNLMPAAGGGRFSFEVDNLPVGTYAATLSAYLDTGESLLAGSAASPPFGVAAGATTLVSFPALRLAPTPVGGWAVTASVTLPRGYLVSTYQYALMETDGTQVPTGSVATAVTRLTKSWANVMAYAPAASTASVTVSGTRRGWPTLTKTAIATATVVAGATVSSTVTVAL